MHAWPELYFQGARLGPLRADAVGPGRDHPELDHPGRVAADRRPTTAPTTAPTTPGSHDEHRDPQAVQATATCPTTTASSRSTPATGSATAAPRRSASALGVILLLGIPWLIRILTRRRRFARPPGRLGVEGLWAEIRDTSRDLGLDWSDDRHPPPARRLADHQGPGRYPSPSAPPGPRRRIHPLRRPGRRRSRPPHRSRSRPQGPVVRRQARPTLASPPAAAVLALVPQPRQRRGLRPPGRVRPPPGPNPHSRYPPRRSRPARTPARPPPQTTRCEATRLQPTALWSTANCSSGHNQLACSSHGRPALRGATARPPTDPRRRLRRTRRPARQRLASTGKCRTTPGAGRGCGSEVQPAQALRRSSSRRRRQRSSIRSMKLPDESCLVRCRLDCGGWRWQVVAITGVADPLHAQRRDVQTGDHHDEADDSDDGVGDDRAGHQYTMPSTNPTPASTARRL